MERTVEVIDEKFVFRQDGKEVRELIYNYKICVGCGICVYACPVNVIELQPVHDIALGLDMPPVTIDHTSCVFCGICFALCPVKAFEFRIDGMEVKREFCPIWLKGVVERSDGCVDCAICYRLCPTEAIVRRVRLRREDIPIRNERIEGEIRIDENKCRLCGICVEFCQAFKAFEGDEKPFERIVVDESLCDYCELCMDICPNDAIYVRGRRIVENKIEKVAEVEFNDERCIYCGICAKFCPYEGVRVEKSIDGRVVIYEGLIESKCDPVGCKACVIVCPTDACKIMEGKVVVDEDICIHCGACENACDRGLIVVRRYEIRLGENDTPWTEGWKMAVARVIERRLAEIKREEEVVEEIGKAVEFEPMEFEVSERLLKRLEEIEEILKKLGFRRKIELR